MLRPFMEIERWDVVGMSVEESAKRLRRIAWLDRQLMRIEAGHMTARPEYEIKGALGRLTWQDADHYDQLRSRGKQLRTSPSAFDKCPDNDLAELTEQSLRSPTTLCLLVALFEVVKPAQLEAIGIYLNKAQPLVDEPTRRLLGHQLMDREAQLAWGREAIAHISGLADEAERELAARWRSWLLALLAAAGGPDGSGERKPADASLAVPAEPFALPDKSTRDGRFATSVVKMRGMAFEDDAQGRLLQMMLHRYFEMSPAEAIAYVHFAAEDKPWGFYRDTARHIWDEVRHCWFGEAALRAKGYDVYGFENWTGWYDMTSQLFEGEEAYTHLTIAIEKAGMKYPPGKREEWEFCRDIVQDPLMTTFQDFDWADEVTHAGFGQRWIVDSVFGGDPRQAQAAADATVAKRAAFMARSQDGGGSGGGAGGY
ncbi:hypothetical protein [Paenibacillus sacheonensis]|uniref:DUF455 family protein n=1 Tax=Paenibacillus sacheonensis TaxID=742054 RepID=A0A7X4YP38_9BACL|nr:hypothetical protein [Paenibacillus sacheonensis]MBM7565292.1 hypothetical protein [Paenibacillus sacheonensis]NBC69937.1 hypothetical protein [Paenibacillus sacheonensis]